MREMATEKRVSKNGDLRVNCFDGEVHLFQTDDEDIDADWVIMDETSALWLHDFLGRALERLQADHDAVRREAESRVGIREARRVVTWLHERANGMNDPHARAVLNLAADELGRRNAEARTGPASQPDLAKPDGEGQDRG